MKTPTAASPQRTKSQQLATLRARAQAAWDESERRKEPLWGDGPVRKKWHALRRQIDKLEASFVHYQGRDIDAVHVSYQSGDISVNERSLIEGDESLYRDSDGGYYLFRRKGHDGRPQVHRISMKCALLWAVTRANPRTNHLRRDAVSMLARKEAA